MRWMMSDHEVSMGSSRLLLLLVSLLLMLLEVNRRMITKLTSTTSTQSQLQQQQQQQQFGPAFVGPAPVGTAQAKPGTTTTTTTTTATTRDGTVNHPSITISPATSNQNLKFVGNFKRTFRASSLRSAFRNHPAFTAVFEDGRGGASRDQGHWRNINKSDGTEKFPGKIVALSSSEDFRAAGRGEMKGVDMAAAATAHAEFALTGAPKGLVSVIMDAYNRHCDLVLSPDDVWLTILAQFCAYVNNNAEGLRDRIVKHQGKKELEVSSFGSLETANYPGMIRELLVKIRENIKSPELADWFRPGFSTTTEKEEVCAAASSMASLQAYFEFTMNLLCGIPSVTMLGNVADWKLLREKVDRLLEFEVQGNPEGNVMELWVRYLRKACDGFVESAEHPGSPKTLEFWDKVLSHRGGGSGTSYITGWLSAFTVFDKDGNFIGNRKDEGEDVFDLDEDGNFIGIRKIEGADFPLIDTNDICHNVVSCPVKINDNGLEYDGNLFTGQVAFEAKQGAGEEYPTVRPRNDWCMAVAVKE